MSEFQGLHNPERHKSFSGEWAECLPDLGGCLSECGEGDPCRCCLAAEVKRLTAELADRDRRIDAALALHARGERCAARSVNEHSCSGWKCSACYGHWPCATVVALRGTDG